MCPTCPPDLGAPIHGQTWPASPFGSAASSDPGDAGKPLETTLYQKLNTHNNTTYLSRSLCSELPVRFTASPHSCQAMIFKICVGLSSCREDHTYAKRLLKGPCFISFNSKLADDRMYSQRHSQGNYSTPHTMHNNVSTWQLQARLPCSPLPLSTVLPEDLQPPTSTDHNLKVR